MSSEEAPHVEATPCPAPSSISDSSNKSIAGESYVSTQSSNMANMDDGSQPQGGD